MDVTGPAILYDGRAPLAREAVFLLDSDALSISATDGTLLAHWPLATIRRARSRPEAVRLGVTTGDARLEVTEPGAAFHLDNATRDLPRLGHVDTATRRRFALWSAAALASLGLFLWPGVPMIARALVPLVSVETEVAFGAFINDQIVAGLAGKGVRVCRGEAGSAALRRLIATLNDAANTRFPVTAEVIDIAVPNAFALPGGRIVIFRDLIERMPDGEHLAAIVSHELGQVAHRDGLKSLTEVAGLSATLGLLSGDFTGSGITVLVARHMLQANYSRAAEADADTFGAGTLQRLKADPALLARALERIAQPGEANAGPNWLSTHPATTDRIERLTGRAHAGTRMLMTDGDFTAIRKICE